MPQDPAVTETHVDEGLALLLGQAQDKPRIEGVLAALLGPIEDLDAEVVNVYTARLLDNAADAQLDVLGSIVGEVRGGKGDDEYRRAINTRILINTSDGKIPQLIAVADLYENVTASGGTVRVKENYPAALVVTLVDHTLNRPPQETAVRLRQAKLAGVRLSLVYLPTGDSATTFTFGDASAPASDPDRGFGSTTEVTGGALAGVV